MKPYDYILHPKEDGYRSVHLVYKYRTDSPKQSVYNGMRIEIQIRTRLQHLWATAVETVSIFTDQALKYSIGEEDWKRFFILMSSAIAVRERRPPVPNAPTDPAELKEELRQVSANLNAESALTNFGMTVQILGQKPHVQILGQKPHATGAQIYLLKLDPTARQITVSVYPESGRAIAEVDYAEAEKRLPSEPNPGCQVVLVSVDSLAALPRAYPNFYLDTAEFLQVLRQEIA